MKIKEKTKDFIIILTSAICLIIALEQARKTNEANRTIVKYKDSLELYKNKLKQCDYSYTANHKKLDSLAKEHYKCYDVSYRTLENVKKLRRFVKENKTK